MQRPGGLAGGIGPHQLAQPVLLVTGRGQVGEDGGHEQPGGGLRGRLSSVPARVSVSGARCATTTRAVAPIGMTVRWVDLGMKRPSLPDSGPADIPVRLTRCHVPAVN